MTKPVNAKNVTDEIYRAAISSHPIETKIINKTREVDDKYKRRNPILSISSFVR